MCVCFNGFFIFTLCMTPDVHYVVGFWEMYSASQICVGVLSPLPLFLVFFFSFFLSLLLLWQVTFTGPLFFFFNHRKGNKSALRCWRSEGKGKKDETCAFFFLCVCVRICYSTSVACQKWQSVCCGCTEKRGDGAVDAGSRATEGRVRSFFFSSSNTFFKYLCLCSLLSLLHSPVDGFCFPSLYCILRFFFIFVSGGRQQGESGLYSE